MMDITIVFFCYRGEEEILPFQALYLSKILPEANLHLIDDSCDPIPSAIVEKIKARNPKLKYRLSHFNRNRNLNGETAVKGIVNALAESADIDGNSEGIIIKLDPDTLLLRPKPILDGMAKKAQYFTYSSVKAPFSGGSYMLQRDVLQKIQDIVAVIPFDPDPRKVPEDVCICSLASFVTGRQAHIYMNLREPKNSHLIGAFNINSLDDPEAYKIALNATTHALITSVGNITAGGLPPAYRVKVMSDIIRHNIEFSAKQKAQNDKASK